MCIPSTFKVSEGLTQLERLDNNPLLLLVISDLGVSGQREILPQWVTIEAVIGHDASQIGVVGEEDTKQIPDFALIPVGTVVKAGDGWNGGGLVGVGLDTDTRVVADGQHVVDNLEALVAGGVVDSGNVAHCGELGGCVVFEEAEDGDDARGGDVDGELILPDGEPVDG